MAGEISNRMTGVVDGVLPALSGQLVPPEALARIREVTDWLPATFTDCFYFECRLSVESSRVDFVLQLEREAARQLIADQWPADPRLRAAGSWDRIVALARWWLADPLAQRAIHALWLEFDLPETTAFGGFARPRVFCGFEPDWVAQAPVETVSALSLRMLDMISAEAPSAGCQRAVTAALTALSGPGRVGYAGYDPQQAGRLRLCLGRLDRRLLAGKLAALAGETLALEVERAMGPLVTPGRCLVAHLDLADELLPAMGLEVSFARLPGMTRVEAPALHGLLDQLAPLGMCRANVGPALQAWPGEGASRPGRDPRRTVMRRRVNHVKLRIEQGRLAEAKVYLRALRAAAAAEC